MASVMLAAAIAVRQPAAQEYPFAPHPFRRRLSPAASPILAGALALALKLVGSVDQQVRDNRTGAGA